MPLLFAVGQHQALEAVYTGNSSTTRACSPFWMTSTWLPHRSGWEAVYAIVQEELRVHACIRIHTGKTKVWNRAGVRSEACKILERIARQDDPTAVVWVGSDVPTSEQGLKILGTPLRAA